MLEQKIRKLRAASEILVMTHIVIGYPDLAASYDFVKAMVEGGVEIMELQIPFSEPIADGPVIEQANQRALASGITVKACLDFAERVAAEFPIPFLLMSYYNILFRFGVGRFAAAMKQAGVHGAIIPDLPHEEGREYIEAMRKNELDPIFLFAPTTSDARMKEIAGEASGFIYCVARKGVTGLDTSFGAAVSEYLARARRATSLPLAVGFGIKEKGDIDFLKGKADIAIIGSEMIRIANQKGVDGVREYLAALR